MVPDLQQDLSGILLLDKPKGLSSNGVLQRVKRLWGASKAGHGGSLDPLATGMLPIYFNEATKFSQYLLNADKHYWVTAKLGVKTTTGDAEGTVTTLGSLHGIDECLIEKTLARFLGVQKQVPPIFSALKHEGQPLYRYARQGIDVERAAREISIHKLRLIHFIDDTLTFYVHCTKGTYIRTLVEDIGDDLACGAYVTDLRRVKVGPYHASQMISLDDMTEVLQQGGDVASLLLPVDATLHAWPAIRCSSEEAQSLHQGQEVTMSQTTVLPGPVRLICSSGAFMGIGEMLPSGRVAPRRLLSHRARQASLSAVQASLSAKKDFAASCALPCGSLN